MLKKVAESYVAGLDSVTLTNQGKNIASCHGSKKGIFGWIGFDCNKKNVNPFSTI